MLDLGDLGPRADLYFSESSDSEGQKIDLSFEDAK